MINWIITSSVLIAVILAVRKFFGNKLTPGLQYGLWLFVLLRLLIPVSFFHSSYSAAELTVQVRAAVEQVFSQEPEQYVLSDTEYITEDSTAAISDEKFYPEDHADVVDHAFFPAEDPDMFHSPFSGDSAVFYVVWLIGMGAAGGVFLMVNLFLRIRIYSDREEIGEEELAKRNLMSKVPVYITRYVDTPCLAGLKTAAVYLPVSFWRQEKEGAKDPERADRELGAMICHENIHYRHGDQLWGFLRLLCLTVHWYNPLVWAAALASKQDAELFCDEAVVKEIGVQNRFEYGRLLVRVTAQEKGSPEKFFVPFRYAGLCNTEMTDSKRHMKQRIEKLAGAPERNTVTAILTLLVSLTAFVWLFLGDSGDEKFLEEGAVDVKLIPREERADDTFFPTEEQAAEVRETALQGMSAEETAALADYLKGYHNWLEAKLLYENWESRLSDKESIAWNYIDRSGTVQAGWMLEWNVDADLKTEKERREYMKQRYPEYGEIPLEELERKYGEPYYEENAYGAEAVIQRMDELTASAENKAFRRDVEALCEALRRAKDTHEADYVMQAHEIVHDMEYFLLRYSPRDVASYTADKSLSGRYYGVLEVWKAWREGTL